MKLKIGISTCPNDTFAFHAILTQKVDLRGLTFDIELLSVQELNERLAAKDLDFSKASFHAALHLSDYYGVIRTGASMGIKTGPLLLAGQKEAQIGPESLVLCPGAETTATLLFRCLFPDVTRIEQRPFLEIVPALKRKEADFGVVIHEEGLTYHKEGLHLSENLGVLWNSISQGPVPLAGILARLNLSADIHKHFSIVLRDSIAYAFAHRDETLPTIQHFAQELEASVIWSYVDLYVNQYTLDLGKTGEKSIAKMQKLARKTGIITPKTTSIKIFD